MTAHRLNGVSPSTSLLYTRDVRKLCFVIFFKEKMVHQVKQTIAIRIHTRCWFSNGRSVSGRGMTHVQNAREEKVQQIFVPEFIRIQITLADKRLTMCSPIEVHAVIRCEWPRGTRMSVIYERLQTAYGEKIISRQMVGRWCCMFSERRQSLQDEGRSRRPFISANENNIVKVQDSQDFTYKTMLRWSRLCDNFLRHHREPSFTREVPSNWLQATINVSMSVMTMSKNSARSIIHDAMMYCFSQ